MFVQSGRRQRDGLWTIRVTRRLVPGARPPKRSSKRCGPGEQRLTRSTPRRITSARTREDRPHVAVCASSGRSFGSRRDLRADARPSQCASRHSHLKTRAIEAPSTPTWQGCQFMLQPVLDHVAAVCGVERSLDERTGEDLLLWRQIGLFSLTSTCDAASMSLAILTIVT